MQNPSPPLRRKTATDLVWISLSVVVCFVVASQLDVSELLASFFKRHESLQLDEWLLSLLVFSIGLCWFAFRRNAETDSALSERIAAEKKVAELLRRNRDLSQAMIRVQEDERRALKRRNARNRAARAGL